MKTKFTPENITQPVAQSHPDLTLADFTEDLNELRRRGNLLTAFETSCLVKLEKVVWYMTDRLGEGYEPIKRETWTPWAFVVVGVLSFIAGSGLTILIK